MFVRRPAIGSVTPQKLAKFKINLGKTDGTGALGRAGIGVGGATNSDGFYGADVPGGTQSTPGYATPGDDSTPSTSQSIIPDPTVYAGETAQALQAYQSALSAISARRANTLHNYGMTAKVDANGNLIDYGIDPTNQYGAIQSLLGQQGSALDQARHASVARGLGHAGLGAQDENALRFQQGGQTQQLGQQFVGEVGQEASDQVGAQNQYSNAKFQAQRDAIASAIMNGYFTPAAASTPTVVSTPATNTVPPAKTTTTPTYKRQTLFNNNSALSGRGI